MDLTSVYVVALDSGSLVALAMSHHTVIFYIGCPHSFNTAHLATYSMP